MSVNKCFRFDDATKKHLADLAEALGTNQTAVITDLVQFGYVLVEGLKKAAPESDRIVSLKDFLLIWSEHIAIQEGKK